MARHILLPELVITAASLKPFQQVLAVDILDDRSLHHAGETLENPTACTTLSFVDVDNGLSLAHIVAFNSSSLLGTRLLARHIASSLCAILCRRIGMLRSNLIEISLMQRLHVKTIDQVRNFGSLI